MSSRQKKITIRRELELWQLSMYLLPEALSQVLEKESQQLLLGCLLKARGYTVTMQKFDPYINIDPGTMNPVQHGEVFVTDDGAETDLDLGHYERFIDESLTKNSNVTTGKIYWSVLQKERRGDFGGGTVQVIPHITNEIKSRFYRNPAATDTEIAIIEVGGTVGDIESQPFLESIRQFQHDMGHDNVALIHVTLIPYLHASQEMKTKTDSGKRKRITGNGNPAGYSGLPF